MALPKILHIEDEEFWQEKMEAFHANFDFTFARTEEEALQILQKDKFDLVLLDLKLKEKMSDQKRSSWSIEKLLSITAPLICICTFIIFSYQTSLIRAQQNLFSN